MVEPLLHDIEQPPINPRRVWALRVASIMFIFPALALVVVHLLEWEPPLPYLTGMVSLVLYPAVLWGLRTARPKRLCLVLAVTLGSLWVVLSANYAWEFTASRFRREPAPPSSTDILLLLVVSSWVLMLLHAAYVGVAWRLWRSISGGRTGLLKLIGAIVGGSTWGALVIIYLGLAYEPPGQSPVVGALRTLNTAEITYSSTYGETSTSNLAQLAPPPRGVEPSPAAAGLIDSALASGTKRYSTYRVGDDIVDEIDSALGRKPDHAYHYDYRPGPRDAHGRIVTYTICARPIDRFKNQENSYFIDETGVLRATSEDRCPTAKDPPIAG